MKKLFISVAIVSLIILSCSETSSGNSDLYGDNITIETSTALATILADRDANVGMEFKIEGVMVEVCQKKGCWINFKDGEEIITVRFKDYGFFMPKDGACRKAKIQGFLVHNTFEETNDAGQIIRTDSYEIVASAVELAKSEKF